MFADDLHGESGGVVAPNVLFYISCSGMPVMVGGCLGM